MNNQKRKEIQEVFESLPTSACYKEAAFMMELSKVTEDPIERDNFIHSHHIGMNVWRKKVWLK